MTNQEHAAHIVRSMITVENPTHCQDIVQALADAGLLMPDLPAPDCEDRVQAWMAEDEEKETND